MSANAPAPLRITRRRIADNEEELVARDGQGYGVGLLEFRWNRKWCQVKWVNVSHHHRRRGIATLLYTEAARIACDELDLPLVSDFDLTEESRGFWEKQWRLDRAKWDAEHEVFILDCKAAEGGLAAAPGDTVAMGTELSDWMIVELKRLFDRADIVLADSDRPLTAEVPGRDKGRHRHPWDVELRTVLDPRTTERHYEIVVETMIPPPKTGRGARGGFSRAVTPAQPTDLAYAYYTMIFDRACHRRDPFVDAHGYLVDAHDVGIWASSVLSGENQSREVRLALDVWRMGVRLTNEIERIWKSEFPKARLPTRWYRGVLDDEDDEDGPELLMRTYFNRLGAWDPFEHLSSINVHVHIALNWPNVQYQVRHQTPLWTPPGPYEDFVAGSKNGKPILQHWGGDR